MRISGTHVIKAPRSQVWQRLTDAESIARCLPGVEGVERVGPTRYAMTMSVGIGAIKGTYSGTVALVNVRPPDEYQMDVEATGRPGFVKGTGTVHLNEGAGGTTEVAYAGDVEVGGPSDPWRSGSLAGWPGDWLITSSTALRSTCLQPLLRQPDGRSDWIREGKAT